MDTLLEGARRGGTAEFRALCEYWHGPLLRFATSYCRGDEGAAEDIVQETFLTAWNKIEQIRDAEHLKPWLWRVARFKAISWWRRRKPAGRMHYSLECAAERGHHVPDPAFDPLRRAMRVEPDDPWKEALHAAIERLPYLYVGVMRLYYLREHSARQVAELLQLNETTVKMRLLRGRQLLRALVLEAMGREPDEF